MSDAPARKARPVKLNIIDQPVDAYKGDIARAILYMSIRYRDQDEAWTSSGARSLG